MSGLPSHTNGVTPPTDAAGPEQALEAVDVAAADEVVIAAAVIATATVNDFSRPRFQRDSAGNIPQKAKRGVETVRKKLNLNGGGSCEAGDWNGNAQRLYDMLQETGRTMIP